MVHFNLQRKKADVLWVFLVSSHCLLIDVQLLETWPHLEHLPGLLVGAGAGKGVNFLIETSGKFMEDEKSSPKATPHHYPNEFMQRY